MPILLEVAASAPFVTSPEARRAVRLSRLTAFVLLLLPVATLAYNVRNVIIALGRS